MTTRMFCEGFTENKEDNSENLQEVESTLGANDVNLSEGWPKSLPARPAKNLSMMSSGSVEERNQTGDKMGLDSKGTWTQNVEDFLLQGSDPQMQSSPGQIAIRKPTPHNQITGAQHFPGQTDSYRKATFAEGTNVASLFGEETDEASLSRSELDDYDSTDRLSEEESSSFFTDLVNGRLPDHMSDRVPPTGPVSSASLRQPMLSLDVQLLRWSFILDQCSKIGQDHARKTIIRHLRNSIQQMRDEPRSLTLNDRDQMDDMLQRIEKIATDEPTSAEDLAYWEFRDIFKIERSGNGEIETVSSVCDCCGT